MQQVQNIQGQDREDFFQEIKSIAEFNKKHFFSNKFSDQVKNELKNNLNLAMQQVVKTKGKHYLNWLKMLKKNKMLDKSTSRKLVTWRLRQLRQSCQDIQSNPWTDPDI